MSPAGEPGYGEGIQLDSTSNTVDVYGNTVSTSKQADLLLTGVSGAFIGNVGVGDANMLTDAGQAGMIVGGPGSQCEAQYGNSCAYPDAGYSSTGDSIIDNTSAGNEAGAVVEGAYAAPAFGGSNPGAAVGDSFAGNQWSSNELNVLDFSGYTAGVPVANQYGPNDPNSVPSNTPDNSCDPTPGGSALFEILLPRRRQPSGLAKPSARTRSLDPLFEGAGPKGPAPSSRAGRRPTDAMRVTGEWCPSAMSSVGCAHGLDVFRLFCPLIHAPIDSSPR